MAQRLLGSSQPSCDRELVERAPDHGREKVDEVDVLDQIIEGAALHHVYRHAFIALSGDDDEGDGAARVRHGADEFPALNVAQFQVEQEQVGGVLR